MSQYPEKFRLIFLPFLIIALGAIAAYTFLHWLLIIHLHALVIDEFFVVYLIPALLPLIPLFIWMRPRLKLLELTTSGRGNPLGGLLVLLWIVIALPLVISQHYLITATGKLTQLDAISQITAKPPTKYYKVKQFYVGKGWSRTRPVFAVTGKGNRQYCISIYLTVPVFDHDPASGNVRQTDSSSVGKPLLVVDGVIKAAGFYKSMDPNSIDNVTVLKEDAARPLYGSLAENGAILITTKGLKSSKVAGDPPPALGWPVTWMGISYSETISNSLSDLEKDAEYKRFYDECMAEFNTMNFDQVVYFDRLSYSGIQREYTFTVKAKDGDWVGDDVIIVAPVFAPYEDRNGNKLGWILNSFTVGSIIFSLILSNIKLQEE